MLCWWLTGGSVVVPSIGEGRDLVGCCLTRKEGEVREGSWTCEALPGKTVDRWGQWTAARRGGGGRWRAGRDVFCRGLLLLAREENMAGEEQRGAEGGGGVSRNTRPALYAWLLSPPPAFRSFPA